MTKQEKRISYQAGITRRPSDFLCQDGELAECINLTTDNEELKPMVPPKEWMKAGTGETLPDIIYVHRIKGDPVIIGYSLETVGVSLQKYVLQYGVNDNGTYSRTAYFGVNEDAVLISDAIQEDVPPTSIVSVGKILVVSFPDKTYYFQWDNGHYKGMGTSLPEIRVDFSMEHTSVDYGRPLAFSIANLIEKESVSGPAGAFYYKLLIKDFSESNYEAIKNVLIGAISSRIRKVAELKRFAFPFWARYAVRLYDGSYTAISQPFLLFPTVDHNCDIFFADDDGNEFNMFMQDWEHGQNINYRPVSAELKVRITGDIQGWEDIISGIDIFVSDQQVPFNLEGDWHFINPFDAEHVDNTVISNRAAGAYQETTMAVSDWVDQTTEKLGFVTYFGMTHYDDEEIMQGLLDKSIFYRIAQIDRSEFAQYASAQPLSGKITQHTLQTLTSQTRLDHDDYYSHNAMTANIMKAYNMRLHLADIRRGFFAGFDSFTSAEYGSGYMNYRIVVSIKTDGGIRYVVREVSYTGKIMNIWFYYPDPRATKVQIYGQASGSWKLLFDLPLKEHKMLNGTYFFDHLPYKDETAPAGEAVSGIPYETNDNNTKEEITDRVFVSEVNNPFVFTSKGEVKVGQGDIIGLATQTVALGQEEHGLHPLIVFTERGISTLKVADEGYYLRSDELNREVCINPESITETDGAVFFVSKKGLMVLVGEKVRCVSEQANGLPFSADGIVGLTGNAAPWADIITACKDWYLDNGQRKVLSFLGFISDKKCRIAYDYIDSRLLLIHSDKTFAFVFNMADGAISKTVLPGTMKAVVSNYPDYIMQSGNTVYTLYGKDLEESLTDRAANSPNDMQRAFILTRPIKLAGPLTVSSLRELVNVGTWQKDVAQDLTPSEVKTEVWLSDDLVNWHLMSSRFGAAAKYFRIGLFVNMLPVERLSGTILTEQERRTNNLRA